MRSFLRWLVKVVRHDFFHNERYFEEAGDMQLTGAVYRTSFLDGCHERRCVRCGGEK